MATQDLFQELKDVLADFKGFLDGSIDDIRPAITQVAALIPQVNDLIDLLVDLLGKLKTEIGDLDVGAIPGLSQLSDFTGRIDGLLDAARKLLPGESGSIDEIADVADVVTGLPSLDDVKQEITDLIDAIVVHLTSLRA